MQGMHVARTLPSDGVVLQQQIGPFCQLGAREGGERVLADPVGQLFI